MKIFCKSVPIFCSQYGGRAGMKYYLDVCMMYRLCISPAEVMGAILAALLHYRIWSFFSTTPKFYNGLFFLKFVHMLET